MFGFTAIKLAIGAAIVFAVLGSYYYAYTAGRSAMEAEIVSAIKDGRIKLLKEGKEIDAKVENLEDDGLCIVLGGC